MALPSGRLSGWTLLIVLLGTSSVRAEDGDIVLGMSAAFTGPSRGPAIELYRGSMAYFDQVNRTGGIHGRSIRLLAYDDGYDPSRAIQNSVRLVENDHALLLYAYAGRPTVTRVLPLLKRYGDRSIYLFFPFTGAEPQRRLPFSKHVFNLRNSYAHETAGLVENFFRLGKKRIAIFYQIDAYGRSGWAGVREALAKNDAKMTGEATYRRGTAYSESMAEQVAILREGTPDAVICVGSYAACAAFIRDARDANWDVPIANVSFVGSENLLALLLRQGEVSGKDYTSNLINSRVVPSYHNLELPAVREYRDLMTSKPPAVPRDLVTEDYQPLPFSFCGFEGFLDAKVLVEISRRCPPDLNPRDLRKAAESLKDFDPGIGIPVSFGSNRHQALSTIYYTAVAGGLFVPAAGWR
jgi:branched-chain amino acid transport system substrate-binding protein